MNKVFQLDYQRYYGLEKAPFFNRLFPPLEIRYIKWYRFCQKYNRNIYGKYKLRLLSKKTHIQIPSMVSIGPGFYIGHFGRIIINHHVKAGNNFTIFPGVLIGQEERGKRKGVPTFGNDVWIGSNATIVGKIQVGNDVLISPNSYVNFDVPDHSVVIGNPATIIHRDKATEHYIKNKINLFY